MEIYKEISEILLSNQSVPMLLWSGEKGWRTVCEGGLSIDGDSLSKDGLWALREIVLEEDLKLYDAFLQKIKEYMDGEDAAAPERENYLEEAVHLKIEETYSYYKIECYQEMENAHIMRKMLVRIPELEAEDIYRIHLAEVITNDKNPAFFTQGAKELMDRHPDWNYALVQFDVAKFKMINEQYGEQFGDELIEFFIHSLKLLCNKEQLYTRLTADVFMILTPFMSQEGLLEFVEYLRDHLSSYKDITYRLVFGICKVADRKQNLRKYGDGAALARQSIKEDALNHVAFYREDMKDKARMNKFIEDNMEKALENREFVMYLQPKYSISKDQMVGAEALVRWLHPEHGLIPPMSFVPLFEKNGFIVKMDAFIWEEACRTIRKWMDDGMAPIPISVNVSRKHLKDGSFVDTLNRLTEQYGIPKQYLEIEITESVESKDVKEGANLLKKSGFTLLMDDFGSGYSSLNTLKDTQFDVIKIDREFLQDFIGSDRGKTIVEHTVKMTREIGLDLVAEGIETKEQAMFLSECGCDVAQGFYYARPMSVDDFNKKYAL